MTSLKVIRNEGPDQAPQGKRLAPETMLRTQRSRLFPNPEKWLFFGILANGGHHEHFLESFNFTNG